jgi:hypothetical protein
LAKPILRIFELRSDQVDIDSLALRLEVDSVFHEELRLAGAGAACQRGSRRTTS